MRLPLAPSRRALLAIAIVSIWAVAGTTIALHPTSNATTDAARASTRASAEASVDGDLASSRLDARERVKRKRPPARVSTPRRTAVAGDGSDLFDIEVEPSCLSPGDRGVVRLRTVPQVQFSLIVFYHADDPRQSWHAGVTESGTFDYPFVVPPDTPTTTGEVQVAGQRMDGKAADTVSARFQVEPMGACR